MDPKSYPLSGEQLRSIYKQRILPEYKEGMPSVLSPRFVIICAQPGAGKSGLSTRLRDAFIASAQEAVHVDVDDMRRFHARLKEIVAEDAIHMGEHTNHTVNIWKGFLLDDTRADSNNVILEITLRSADAAKSEIEKFQKDGYGIELHAMAVHQHVSRLGVFQRFERAITSTNKDTPRYVPLSFHDAAYHALPRNVNDIERNFSLNLVTVNTRSGDVVYRRSEQEGVPAAMEAILLERSRSWTAEDRSSHISEWNKIVESVRGRPRGQLKDTGYLKDLRTAVSEAVGQPVIHVPSRAIEQDIEDIIRKVVNARGFGI